MAYTSWVCMEGSPLFSKSSHAQRKETAVMIKFTDCLTIKVFKIKIDFKIMNQT